MRARDRGDVADAHRDARSAQAGHVRGHPTGLGDTHRLGEQEHISGGRGRCSVACGVWAGVIDRQTSVTDGATSGGRRQRRTAAVLHDEHLDRAVPSCRCAASAARHAGSTCASEASAGTTIETVIRRLVYYRRCRRSMLLEVSVLVALAWPTLRAASSAAVSPRVSLRRRSASGSRPDSTSPSSPRWRSTSHAALRLPAVAATAIGAILLWRSRPDYGVSSGLAAGIPGAAAGAAAGAILSSTNVQALRHGPVFKVSQFGQPTVCLVGLDRANRLLLEHDEQLVAPPLPFSRFIEGGYLRYLPEQTHDRYRRVVSCPVPLRGRDQGSRAAPGRRVPPRPGGHGQSARPATGPWSSSPP